MVRGELSQIDDYFYVFIRLVLATVSQNSIAQTNKIATSYFSEIFTYGECEIIFLRKL